MPDEAQDEEQWEYDEEWWRTMCDMHEQNMRNRKKRLVFIKIGHHLSVIDEAEASIALILKNAGDELSENTKQD